MNIAAVIFDFNGVLWWDGHLQDQAWKAYSQKLRGWPLSAAEMDVHVHGRNNRYTLEYLLAEEVTGTRLAALSEEKETVYRELCLAQGADFRLSPGAIEFLDFLAQRQIPRTIATASAWPNVDFFVEHLHLADWFQVAQIVYDDGQKAGKPAPDFYLHAARALAQDPAHCVVIEDSLAGVAAAKAAGIGLIIALGPRENHPALQLREGVDMVIANMHDIPRSLFATALV